MSFQSRRELWAKISPRYREASRKQKTVILNEFIAATGYKRKYAIRLLSQCKILMSTTIKRPRARFYGQAIQDALIVAWASSNYIASKRLAPFLKELIPALEYHGHLQLTNDIRDQLVTISPATIDRLLKPWRSSFKHQRKNSTHSGKLIRKQIPIRTFSDWDKQKPGYFEADLVLHCGGNMSGSFLCTFVLTDIATGWVECIPLIYRSKHTVINALEHASKLIPFPILGLDTDNGTEFINRDLMDYCEKKKVKFTRGRAYKKNDQCFVEQKNGAVVRQLVGYDRFEGQQAYKQLTELYRAVRLYVNFFQPSMKLKKKVRESSKVHRTYHDAQTPFQRVLTSDYGNTKRSGKLRHIYQALDPIRLLKQLETLQDALWQHSILLDGVHSSGNIGFIEKRDISFKINMCSLFGKYEESYVSEEIVIRPAEGKKRKYRKRQKPRVPHYWRTREDSFKNVWEEISKWLENNPERTATSLLSDLQNLYPGQYLDNQLRTLQRRVQKWRAKAIITFDDNWINEDLLTENTLPKNLKAENV